MKQFICTIYLGQMVESKMRTRGRMEGREERQQKIYFNQFHLSYWNISSGSDGWGSNLKGTSKNPVHIHFTLNTGKTLINVLETADIKCSRDLKICHKITCSITNFPGLFLWKNSLKKFSGPDGGVKVEKKQGEDGWRERF